MRSGHSGPSGYVNERLIDVRNEARFEELTTQMTLARQHYLERVVLIGGAEDVVGLLDFRERKVVSA